MSKGTRVYSPIHSLLLPEVEEFDSLAELALDMHWSWNHATDEVWRRLDPPRYSANRTVREYTEQHYLPAAAAYRERAAEEGGGQADGSLAPRTGAEMGHATLRRSES